MKKLFLPLLVTFFAFIAAIAVENPALHVIIRGLNNSSGQVRVYVFDNADNFPRKTELASAKSKSSIKDKKAEVTFTGLAYGKYAIAVHHDENGNDKVDTNFLGIPNENFASSNDAKGTFGPPDFEDAVIEFSASKDTVYINFDK